MINVLNYFLSISFPIVLGLTFVDLPQQYVPYVENYLFFYEIYAWIVLVPVIIMTTFLLIGNASNSIINSMSGSADKIKKIKTITGIDKYFRDRKKIIYKIFIYLSPIEIGVVVLHLGDMSLGTVLFLTSVFAFFLRNSLDHLLLKIKALYEKEIEEEKTAVYR